MQRSGHAVPARTSAARLLVLQATQFCNIDCTYCYVPNRTRPARVSDEVLDAVRRQVIEGDRLAHGGLVLWHSGEPLAIGLSGFVGMRQRLFGDRRPPWIREQVQTNGTLIDTRWAGYLKANGVMAGVSVDGPAWLHDRRRVNRAGTGTHGAVIAGISALRQFGVDFSIICVVGEDALDCAQEVFEFLRDLGPKVIGFSVEKVEGANHESSLDAVTHFGHVRDFFSTVTRANRQAGHPVIIREVEQTVSGLAPTAQERLPSDEATMGRIISVSLEGQVGFFSPEMITNPPHPVYGAYTFGNLLRDRFDDIEARALTSQLMTDVTAGAAACRSSCAYWRFCGGGSPSAKISETGSADSTLTSFCILSKQAGTLGILDGIVEEPSMRGHNSSATASATTSATASAPGRT